MRILELARDPLYKNSFFLALSSISNAAFGFFFWMLAARLYSINDVGIATALISSLGLVALFSRLGFDFSLIRFLPNSDKKAVFSTCLSVTMISSAIFGFAFVLSSRFFSPSLSFLQNPVYASAFVFFAVLSSVAFMSGYGFISMRRTENYFFQNLFLASRIPFLIPLAFLGFFGIFSAVGFAYLIASIFGLLLIRKFFSFDLRIEKNFVRESLRFSSGNYLSSILSAAPTLILPIMVLNLLNEAEAAKYYIAFSIGSLILVIPNSLSTSLFVEGSHGESLRRNTLKASFAAFSLLIPSVIFIYFFGDVLLSLFGKSYLEALDLLKLLAFSSFFVCIYSFFISIQRVRMKVESILKLDAMRFILLLGLSYALILKFGIVGVGYAWIAAYAILILAVAAFVKKERWI